MIWWSFVWSPLYVVGPVPVRVGKQLITFIICEDDANWRNFSLTPWPGVRPRESQRGVVNNNGGAWCHFFGEGCVKRRAHGHDGMQLQDNPKISIIADEASCRRRRKRSRAINLYFAARAHSRNRRWTLGTPGGGRLIGVMSPVNTGLLSSHLHWLVKRQVKRKCKYLFGFALWMFAYVRKGVFFPRFIVVLWWAISVFW